MLRYIYTIRHLKLRQIYYRLWYRVTKPLVDKRPAPELRAMPGGFHSPARRRVSLSGAETFLFLNQSGSLAELGWNADCGDSAEPVSKLWRYNQHYFDDLNAMEASKRREWHRALLCRWVRENPTGRGTGWEPYPTSLRVVNWIKWACAGNVLNDMCVHSLAIQTRWLAKRIEWHILGNHLFANAKALVFAGVFFSGEEAGRWLRKGLKIVNDEVAEQVLADGGNFERSPMYHAIFFEDLLDLLNLANAFPDVICGPIIARLREAAGRMRYWLDAMTLPDGETAFFNDAAIGIAPDPADLFSYAQRLSVSSGTLAPGVTHLADSGYIRLASATACALLDVAPVGPDYLPGHAHADTLSFELSVFDQRVLVNGGTSEYGAGDVRGSERGTAAHNTVVVNSENSSEVWGGFRVARRACPRDLSINAQGDLVKVACAHDGYRRLRGRPMHRRLWQFSQTSFVIEDQIDGSFDHAFAYFHLHPCIKVSIGANEDGVLHLPQGHKVSVCVELGKAQWIASHYAPEFGKRFANQCLKVALGGKGARLRMNWGLDD